MGLGGVCQPSSPTSSKGPLSLSPRHGVCPGPSSLSRSVLFLPPLLPLHLTHPEMWHRAAVWKSEELGIPCTPGLPPGSRAQKRLSYLSYLGK